MDKNRSNCFTIFDNNSGNLLLLLFLSGDFIYLLLHVVNSLSPSINSWLFNITIDYSYSEFYQYTKFFFITILLIRFSFRKEPLNYLILSSIFAYMLVDDSFEIHGNIGGYIIINYMNNINPPLGLRPEDIGELIASAIFGIIFILLFIIVYWKGSKQFRMVLYDFILLILLMVFFGVFFDMVHQALQGGILVNIILEIIEDGGEMVAASLILWYSFLINIRKKEEESYLLDCLRELFRKKKKRNINSE